MSSVEENYPGARQLPAPFSAYWVTPSGAVISTKGRSPRELRQALKHTGGRKPYKQVGLCVDAKNTSVLVHTLVASLFIGPRPDGGVVRHIDGDAWNNHVDNLAWGTPAENFADSRVHGTCAIDQTGVCGDDHPARRAALRRKAARAEVS